MSLAPGDANRPSLRRRSVAVPVSQGMEVFLPSTDGGAQPCRDRLQVLLEALDLTQEAFALTDYETGTFIDCSRAAHERLGYSREEYLALGPLGLQADADHDAAWVAEKLDQLKAQGSGRFENRHRCRNSSAIDVVVHFRHLEVQGRPVFLTMHRDRTELLEARSRAERLNQLLLEAEQLTQVGSWELIHATGELVWSEGTYRIFETNPATFSPSYEAFLAAIHPDDRNTVDRAYRESLKLRQPYQVNHRLCMPDGRQKVLQERGTTSYDAAGNPVRSIGTVQDISRLAEYEEQLERAAYVDSLTNLPNRQGAIRHLTQLLERDATGLGLFNLDLDQFQAFNDTFGPNVGDRLLVSISQVLRQIVPDAAFLARLESDEFLVVLEGELDQLEEQAKALQSGLIQAHPSEGSAHQPPLPLMPSLSIGVCHLPSHGREPLGLLQAANTALMEAKQLGKGRISVYSQGLSERIRQRVALEAELQQAIREQAFHLAFQPQVDRDGAIVGAEVLLRWHDSHGNPVPPSVFIPLAEQSGSIHAIGSWVVEQTCRQLLAWRQQGLIVPRLAVNVSAVQFNLPNGQLAASLLEILDRHGIEPDSLELEITETALIDDPESSRQESLALSKAGFQLAIDDFGTGYASMVSLHTLPVNTIKIDTTFVQRMGVSATDHAIVKNTIQLAHELGLHALAEGVEREDQWQMLRELGCDRFQGYLFGIPMAADAFSKRLGQPAIAA